MEAVRPTVRPLKMKEVPDIIRVWRRSGLSFRVKGRDSPTKLKAQIRNNPDLFLGAFIDGELVGVVLGSDDGRRGWINRLAVLPGFRRSGVASELVKACEKALRRRGRQLFCATITKDNRASMSLFKGLGYEREDYIIYFAKRPVREY